MSEKRYILSHNGKEDGILDKTNDKGYYGFELARLVNELSEENSMLKGANHVLRNNNDSLRRDNEELKKEIKYLQSELHNIRKKTLNEVKLEIEKLERW